MSPSNQYHCVHPSAFYKTTRFRSTNLISSEFRAFDHIPDSPPAVLEVQVSKRINDESNYTNSSKQCARKMKPLSFHRLQDAEHAHSFIEKSNTFAGAG